MGVKISEIISVLENVAPPALQENYDNSGLLVGDAGSEIEKVLVSLDCTEAVVDEAIEKGAGLIVSHHPIVFSGLKRLNGKNYIERVVIKAIQNGIALYAIHTNLDNVLQNGVNERIAEKLGLNSVRILSPMKGILKKLVCYCPKDYLETVREAILAAGAGHIGGYDACSFCSEGTGTFRPGSGTNPFTGREGELSEEKEWRLEVVLPGYISGKVIPAMIDAHPYEEVAYDVYSLENTWNEKGAGLIGELNNEMDRDQFLHHLKKSMGLQVVKYTSLNRNKIKKVALCGGSGSFLLGAAMAQGADVFVTADFKYHQFFDGEGKTMICDIGHYESERYTIDLIGDILNKGIKSEKKPNFAVILTNTDTNPVQYYF